MQANISDILTINLDCAFANLAEAKQNLQDRALASSCPAYYAHFHTRLHIEAEIINRWFQGRPILHHYIFELNLAQHWPPGLPLAALQFHELRISLLNKIASLFRKLRI